MLKQIKLTIQEIWQAMRGYTTKNKKKYTRKNKHKKRL